jgi:chromosome partitioning protein
MAFQHELNDRTAFSSLHNLGGSLADMNPTDVGGLDRAIQNANSFASEVVDILEKIQGPAT